MGKSPFRAAWITDIHLNFVWDRDRQEFEEEHARFINEIRSAHPDVVLLTGDIAEGPELLWHLEQLATALAGLPIYFVLGNHDSYRSSIHKVRAEVAVFCNQRQDLIYLTHATVSLPLTSRLAVVGDDGWADGRFGELEWSRAKISDYSYIEELIAAGEAGRRKILNELGDASAAHLRLVLGQAVQQFPEVLLLTHVPPWLEASCHRGRLSDYEYAPHFASKTIGEAIVEVMQQAPQCQLTVLCGHTHSAARHQPLPNVLCLAGQAEYGEPRLQRVLEFSS